MRIEYEYEYQNDVPVLVPTGNRTARSYFTRTRTSTRTELSGAAAHAPRPRPGPGLLAARYDWILVRVPVRNCRALLLRMLPRARAPACLLREDVGPGISRRGLPHIGTVLICKAESRLMDAAVFHLLGSGRC